MPGYIMCICTAIIQPKSKVRESLPLASTIFDGENIDRVDTKLAIGQNLPIK